MSSASLIEQNSRPIGPASNHEVLVSTDDSALSDETDNQQLQGDPISPSSLDSQELRLTEEQRSTARVDGQHVPCSYCCVVTDEDRGTRPDGKDVNGDVVGPPRVNQRLGPVNLSLETSNLSDRSSEGDYESAEVVTPCPSEDYSECDLSGTPKSTIEESDRALIHRTHGYRGSNSSNELEVPENISKALNVSWKEPAVDKSDIPKSSLKSSRSIISDLGDRGFYANKNAKGPKSTVSSASDNVRNKFAVQDQFFDALVGVHEGKKGFFPRALLSTLVTEKCVFQELVKCLNTTHNRSQIQAYARTICEEISQPKDVDDDRPPKTKSFKKIFAILVLIEKTSSISKFLEEDVNDLSLPLIKKFQDDGNMSHFDLRLSGDPDRTLECFLDWSQFNIRSFEEWQWTTVSPFFHKGTYKDVQHFPLQDSVMLPFTTDSRRGNEPEFLTEIEGGYGRVFKVNIHPDHHNFDVPPDQDPCFAIKRLNSPKYEDFKQEVEMLKMFSHDMHPHLISLLATYEQFNVYYLIFPCAQGDLNVFWSKLKPKPSFDLDTIKWVAEQCKGIAYGLLKIHNYRTSKSRFSSHEQRWGRHGDLKPENILWFSNGNGGTLKISDFGLAEYSTVHSRSYKPKSRVAASMSYRPPECDLDGGLIGRSYDIWTLGCLYLEFITWLLGGWDYVRIFERKRMSWDSMWGEGMHTDTFFELVKCKNSTKFAARVKPAVKEFMKELHAHKLCTDFLHDFITLIETDILIVKPNNPDERGRITCEEVNFELAKMLKNFRREDYACRSNPWSNVPDRPDEVVEVDPLEKAHWRIFPSYDGPIQRQTRPKPMSALRFSHRRHHSLY